MSTSPGVPDLGSVFMIPNLLGDAPIDSSLPPLIATTVSSIRYFLVEDEKSARAFIKKVAPSVTLQDLTLRKVNEHTKDSEIFDLLAPLRAGSDIGVISEAGCPAIADPGAVIVRQAHALGARVHPMVGPCSMMLALMASGLNGQRWRFHGYLPVDSNERKMALRSLERDARTLGETQIFMETPYRNQRLLEDVLVHCSPELLLCVASDLTTSNEMVRTATLAQWRQLPSSLPKAPALFLLGR
jgi:16S rRNA (cytidine1402-2'-O)-methyltransferase